jgi:hypothetical protein
MDLTSAEAIARTYIAELGRKLGIELILLGDQTIEFGSGWVFFYDSRKYVEGGSISDALAGNAPLIVSKRDGTVHVTGTAHPIEDYIREFERADGS